MLYFFSFCELKMRLRIERIFPLIVLLGKAVNEEPICLQIVYSSKPFNLGYGLHLGYGLCVGCLTKFCVARCKEARDTIGKILLQKRWLLVFWYECIVQVSMQCADS